MNTEEGITLNLIPTSKIFDFKSILEGTVLLKHLSIALGDGLHTDSFNPQKLEAELGRVTLDAVDFTHINTTYTFKITVPPPYKDKIKEVGLLIESPNKEGVLIAYYHQQTAIYHAETLILQLILPHLEDKNKFVSSENSSNAPRSSSMLRSSAVLGNFKASAFDRIKKREYIWGEDYKKEIKIDSADKIYACETITNIAAIFDGNDAIYLFHKGKYSSTYYTSIYDLNLPRLSNPYYSIDVKAPTHTLNSIFGRIEQREVKAYATHPTGVFCFNIDLGIGKLRATSRQQYHPSKVLEDATLANLDDNACLVGGSIGGIPNGDRVSACGRLREEKNCLGPQHYMVRRRNNPIVEYFNEKIYIIGGNRNLYEDAIEVKPVKMKSDGNFNYFAELVPGATIFPKLKGQSSNYNSLSSINDLTYAHCRVGGKIFMFPRDLFKSEEEPPYFIYDVFDETLNINYLPEAMQEKIQEDGTIKQYDTLQIASVCDRLIYFFLTKSTRSNTTTKIMFLDIKPD